MWKDSKHDISPGQCKLKQQCGVPGTPVRMAKTWNTYTQHWEGFGAAETHHVLVGMQNGTGRSAVLHKAKHTLITGSSNGAPRYLLEWLKIYIHTKTYNIKQEIISYFHALTMLKIKFYP